MINDLIDYFFKPVVRQFTFSGHKDWGKRITKVVVHHSAVHFDGLVEDETYTALHSFNEAHQARDWNGHEAPCITYHFAIDRSGRIFQLNNMNSITWHAREANTYSIGVLLLGNYNKQEITNSQVRALNKLERKFRKDLLLSKKDWTWHNEVQKDPTECCGSNLIKFIKRWRG